METEHKIPAKIVIVGLDHSEWETYLRLNLNMELAHTDVVYYESGVPSEYLGQDVVGFSEDRTVAYLSMAARILAVLQVPKLADLDVFLGSGMENVYRDYKRNVGMHVLNSILSMEAEKEELNAYQAKYHGDPCMFESMYNHLVVYTRETAFEYMDALASRKPIEEGVNEQDVAFNWINRNANLLFNDYVRWFASIPQHKNMFDMSTFTRLLSSIVADSDSVLTHYSHFISYTAAVRDIQTLFRLSNEAVVRGGGNYVALIGTAHLEFFVKQLESDANVLWIGEYLDRPKFTYERGRLNMKPSEIKEANRTQFAQLKELLRFKFGTHGMKLRKPKEQPAGETSSLHLL